ncbi:MAG TPA: LD-carboxypeptidase [Limnobacter sp.]|nr:LD-carboxypeptidase [Limnobacter sp.]
MKPYSELVLFSPSGALTDVPAFERALAQLNAMGWTVREQAQARARMQRFAGDDAQRIQAIHETINTPAQSLLMAARGGYGITRLLPSLRFEALAEALNSHQHLLCGHSDLTALQLPLLQAGAEPSTLLHGPMACFDFGPEAGVHPDTLQHFEHAVEHGLVHAQWTCDGHEEWQAYWQGALPIEGAAWGGNLAMVCSLLGTPWMPNIDGGILILEDINEPVYRIERMLLQLLQAGVLGRQRAVLLGQFCEPAPGTHDAGYSLATVVDHIQNLLHIPVIPNFPFGHCTPKACWFQGMESILQASAAGEFVLQQGGHV